jgi:hypothetical protein
MIIILSFICVSLLLVSFISYQHHYQHQDQNSDIRTFLLADSIEEEDYHYNADLI